MTNEPERSRWDPVKNLMNDTENVVLGKHISYWFRKSPRRALHSISYYKFASQMIGAHKSVLDIGCGEGLGTWLLAKECGKATGIDLDSEAISVAQKNWKDPSINFIDKDFIDTEYSEHLDAVVNFDVIEHIQESHIDTFLGKICTVLHNQGIFIAGTPNFYSQQYASAITNAGHVNVYTPERLEAQMRSYFKHVFMFSANDELVHTGFAPLAHYIIVLCCNKRT